MLFIMVVEKLSIEMRSRYPKEQLHVDDLALISESLEGLKKKLKT